MLSTTALVLGTVAALLLVYVYAGYPAVLGIAARRLGKSHETGDAIPSVCIVVAAYQEAAVIADKLANFDSLDYPADKLQMVVVSDESTDGTDEIVSAHDNNRITLLRQVPRAGKASALGLALPQITSDIIVFTDANVIFDASAIRQLVRHFADPAVGAVTGVVHLIDEKTGYAESEGAYYRYERFLQQNESTLCSVVGVDGALYAARRELVQAPSSETILDDFVISMNIACQGHRIIYDDTAQAWEDAAPGLTDEFRRKTRVATGAFQSLVKGWGVPGLATPRLLFCYLSHKVLRWAGPILLMIVFGANAVLAPYSGFWLLLFTLQCAFYALAIAGLLKPELRSKTAIAIPLYFVLMNAAFAYGLYRFLFVRSSGQWRPTQRTQIKQKGQ